MNLTRFDNYLHPWGRRRERSYLINQVQDTTAGGIPPIYIGMESLKKRKLKTQNLD